MVTITRMRRISLIVMMVLGGASTSCHPDDRSTADTRVAQLITRPRRYAHLPAIQQAVIGNWRSSVRATLDLNEHAPRRWRDEVADNLERHPIELRVSDVDYISRTSIKTVHDRYRIEEIKGSSLEVSLVSGYGLEPRRFTWELRDGFLLIYTADGYPFVFERIMP